MHHETHLAPAPGEVLVLMYHGLHTGHGDPGHHDPRYSVHPEAFREQMIRLQELGVAGWLPEAGQPLLAPRPARQGQSMVLVTFDDGDISNIETALPILKEFGMGAVFFITRDFVGRRGMITTGHLRELSDAGMIIGSHGASHRFLNTLTPLALKLELESSRDFLEQLTGRTVVLLSLPGGRGGLRERQTARSVGYHCIFGSRPGNNLATQPGDCIDRVAITRAISRQAFDQILHWRGAAVRRIRLRHRIMQLPKQVLGDRGFDGLRQLWVR